MSVVRRHERYDARARGHVARDIRARVVNGEVAHAAEHGIGKLRGLREVEARRQCRDLILIEPAAQVACPAEATANDASNAGAL